MIENENENEVKMKVKMSENENEVKMKVKMKNSIYKSGIFKIYSEEKNSYIFFNKIPKLDKNSKLMKKNS